MLSEADLLQLEGRLKAGANMAWIIPELIADLRDARVEIARLKALVSEFAQAPAAQ
jgi:hypothetical protein